MVRLVYLMGVVCLLMGVVRVHAQDAVILYVDQNNTELPISDIVVCDIQAPNENYVRIAVVDTVTNLEVELRFPPGVRYIPNSASVTSSTGGIQISYVGTSAAGGEVFSVTKSPLYPGEWFIMRWERDADCRAREHLHQGGLFKDGVLLRWDGGSTADTSNGVRNYDVLTAALALTHSGNVSGPIGAVVSSEITVRNGGLGYLTEGFTLCIVDGPGTETQSLETVPNGTVITGTYSNDTICYFIDPSIFAEFGNGDALMDNGESVVLRRNYIITSCRNNDSYYYAYWGCEGEECQRTLTVQQVSMVTDGAPNLSLQYFNPEYDFCFDGSNAEGGMPKTIVFSIINNGSAPARNIFFHYSTANNSHMDDAPLVVRDGNGNFLFTIDDSISNTIGMYDAYCSVIQPTNRRYYFKFPSNFLLQPGERVDIEIPIYTSNLECIEGCRNSTYVGWYWTYTEVFYHGPCDVSPKVARRYYPYNPYVRANYTVSMPTDMYAGMNFLMRINYSELAAYLRSSTKGYICLEIPLANTGLVYTGGSTITATNGGVIQVSMKNDTLVLKFPNQIRWLNFAILLPFRFECTNGGPNIPLHFMHRTKYNDVDCSGDGVLFSCQTLDLVQHCGCLSDQNGAIPFLFTFKRISTGLADYDNDNIPDGTGKAHPDSIQWDHAINNDTIEANWGAVVYLPVSGPNANQPFNHMYMDFDLKDRTGRYCDNVSEENTTPTWYAPLGDAEVTIIPAGGGAPIQCTVSPTVQNDIALYDLSPCKSQWDQGDSVYIKAYFRVNASIFKGGHDIVKTKTRVFNTYDPYTGDTSTVKIYRCEELNSYMNILSVRHISYVVGNWNRDGCTFLRRYYLRQYLGSGEGYFNFLNEFRQLAVPTSFTITNWPSNFYYEPGTAVFHYHGGNTPIPDANVIESPGKIEFINLDQLFADRGGPLRAPYEYWITALDFVYRPKICKDTVFWAMKSMGLMGDDAFTPSQWDEHSISCGTTLTDYFNITKAGAALYFSGGGHVQTTTDTVLWDVMLNPTYNGTTQGDIWVYLDDPNGVLMDWYIVEDGTTTYYPNADGFIEMGTRVFYINDPKHWQVIGLADGCLDGQVTLYYGRCYEPGMTIDEVRRCYILKREMSYEIHPSEVQLEILSQPPIPMQLCQEQTILLNINSAQAAFLDDPRIEVYLPPGITVQTPINVTYPANTGTTAAIQPTVNGNVLYIDIEDHPGVGDKGLPGTLDALTPDERAAIVELKFTTDCDFISGSSIVFRGRGMRPCGDPATNDNVQIATGGLVIDGAETPYIASISLASQSVENCRTATQEVSISFLQLQKNTTSETDTVYLILESGLVYVPGSFQCTSSPNCLNLAGVGQDAFGNTVLKLSMPSGGFDLSSPLTTSFTIDVESGAGWSCGERKFVRTEVYSYAMDISCAAQMSTCMELRTLVGKNTHYVDKRASAVSLDGAVEYCVSSIYRNYQGSLQLEDVALDVGEQLVIDVYCADSTGAPATYLTSYILTGPMAVGDVFPFADSLPPACDVRNGLLFILSDPSYDNAAQCICANDTLRDAGNEPLMAIANMLSAVQCYGQSNGSAMVKAFGGTAPYSFLWDNGETDFTAVQLNAGRHYVTVTDANGCSDTASVWIEQPDSMYCVVTLVSPARCKDGKPGEAEVQVFGVESMTELSIQWSNGERGPRAQYLLPGLHTVTVTDGTCSTQCSVYVPLDTCIRLEKRLYSLSYDPNTHRFGAYYVIRVENYTWFSLPWRAIPTFYARYTLWDSTFFDDDFVITNVSGWVQIQRPLGPPPPNFPLSLDTTGRWLLADSVQIMSGATHTYYISVGGILHLSDTVGDNRYDDCALVEQGLSDFGGLYNRASIDYGIVAPPGGPDTTPVLDGQIDTADAACGDVPYLTLDKSDDVQIHQLSPLKYEICYDITVSNLGGKADEYMLWDMPYFDQHLIIGGVTYTSSVGHSGRPLNQRPFGNTYIYRLAENQRINPGEVHRYNVCITVKWNWDDYNGYVACDSTTLRPKGLRNFAGLNEKSLQILLELFEKGGVRPGDDKPKDDKPRDEKPKEEKPRKKEEEKKRREEEEKKRKEEQAGKGEGGVRQDTARQFDPREDRFIADYMDQFIEESEAVDDACTDIPVYDVALIALRRAPGFACTESSLYTFMRYEERDNFFITVCNQGAQPVENVQIIGYIPDGMYFDPTANAQWLWDGISRTATYVLPKRIYPGRCENLHIELKAQPGSDWTSYFEIASFTDTLGGTQSDIDSQPDSDKDNDGGGVPRGRSDNKLTGHGKAQPGEDDPAGDEDDHDPVYVSVLDLALRKKMIPYRANVQVGSVIRYRISVYNQGSAPCYECIPEYNNPLGSSFTLTKEVFEQQCPQMRVTIVDYVPEGYVFDPTLNPGWTMTPKGPMYTYTGHLQHGDSFSVEIKLRVQMPQDPDIYSWINYAEIYSIELPCLDCRNGLDTSKWLSISHFESDSRPGSNAPHEQSVMPGSNMDDMITGDYLHKGEDEDDHDPSSSAVYPKLGDYVWYDYDGDGVQDPDEPGVEGVIVRVWDSTGVLIAVDTTDANGYYLFDLLMFDESYYLTFEPPTSMQQMEWTLPDATVEAKDSDVDSFGQGPAVTLQIGQSYMDYDAGLVGLSSLGDYVWEDINGDGLQQPDEPGLPGVTVYLYAADGNLVAVTVTDPQGHYEFTDIVPGDYYLKFDVPAGWSITKANQGTDDQMDSDVDGGHGFGTTSIFFVPPLMADMSWDLGLYRCAKLGDVVWLDLNANGVQDPGENGINGVRIAIYDAQTDRLVKVVYTRGHPTIASNDGYWEVCLPPGQYYIKVRMPNGMVSTLPHQGRDRNFDSDLDHSNGSNSSHVVELESGDVRDDIDVGLYLEARVGNFVWFDANENGLQDPGEPPVKGVIVRAYNVQHQMICETTTDDKGEYMLKGIPPRRCYLKFIPPAGYAFTNGRSLSDDTRNSDVTNRYGTGTTDLVNVRPGEYNPHYDVGLVYGVLAVEIKQFTGWHEIDHNVLQWELFDQKDLLSYALERRHQSEETFTVLREWSGDTCLHKCSYDDYDIGREGLYIYRLKMHEGQGKINYSDEVRIYVPGPSNEDDLSVEVRPNPIRDKASIYLYTRRESRLTIDLFDTKGKRVYHSAEEQYLKGNRVLTIPVRYLPVGVYELRVSDGSQSRTVRFVVQR